MKIKTPFSFCIPLGLRYLCTTKRITMGSSDYHIKRKPLPKPRRRRIRKPTDRTTFIEGAMTGATNVFVFTERMRRSDYWWYFLFCIIVCAVAFFGFLSWVDYMYQRFEELQTTLTDHQLFPYYYTAFSMPVYLFMALFFTAQARRLHDIGQIAWLPVLKLVFFIAFASVYHDLAIEHDSFWVPLGWKGWLLFLPYLGLAVYMAVLACRDSEKERNLYGESPKYRRRLEDNLI